MTMTPHGRITVIQVQECGEDPDVEKMYILLL